MAGGATKEAVGKIMAWDLCRFFMPRDKNNFCWDRKLTSYICFCEELKKCLNKKYEVQVHEVCLKSEEGPFCSVLPNHLGMDRRTVQWDTTGVDVCGLRS